MGQIIRTDGSTQVVAPANGKDYKLEELQKIVGGFIEIVELTGGKIMVINEEGKFYCQENPKATHELRIARLAEYGFSTGDWIAGDVLICKSNEVR